MKLWTILALSLTAVATAAPSVAAECVGQHGVGFVCVGDRNHNGTPDSAGFFLATPAGFAAGFGGAAGSPSSGHAGASAFAAGPAGRGTLSAGAGDFDRDHDGVPDFGGAHVFAAGGSMGHRGFVTAGGRFANFDHDATPDAIGVFADSSETPAAGRVIALP